jgi:hypothetical protein
MQTLITMERNNLVEGMDVNRDHDFIIRILVFSNWEFWSKKPNWGEGGKKTPCHFGQVDFNMSNVIKVVFFTSKIRTI